MSTLHRVTPSPPCNKTFFEISRHAIGVWCRENICITVFLQYLFKSIQLYTKRPKTMDISNFLNGIIFEGIEGIIAVDITAYI